MTVGELGEHCTLNGRWLRTAEVVALDRET
jgi:hypothetical protein